MTDQQIQSMKDEEKLVESKLSDIMKYIDNLEMRHDWTCLEDLNDEITEIKTKLVTLRYNRSLLESRKK